MVADGLLTRQRYREVPPRVDYELTERSRELMPVVGALARWGYDWTWSAPRAGEEVNVGAIFRTGPGLLSPPESVSGVAEMVVEDDRGADRTFVLSCANGAVSISELPAESPEARVRGGVEAWIAALGPEADVSGLRFSGDRPLADTFLKGFVEAAQSAAA
jgi:hypothetical protein